MGRLKECGENKPDVGVKHPIFRRFLFWNVFLVFASTTIYVVFFSPFLAVSNIEIEGVEFIGKDDIAGEIKDELNGKWCSFVPGNNLVVISRKQLERAVESEFRRIKTVKVSKFFPDTLEVKVEERKALLIWCGNDKCYVLDSEGRPFQEADFDSKEVKENNMVVLADTSGEEVRWGQRILSSEYMQFAVALNDALGNNLPVEIDKSIFFTTPSRAAEEIAVKTKEGWNIIFSSTVHLDDSMRALQLILKKELPAGTRSFLEYIDLRADNKVYYKFKEEEKTNEQTEESHDDN